MQLKKTIELTKMQPRPQDPEVRSVCVDPVTNTVLVGTRGCEIIEFFARGHTQIVQVCVCVCVCVCVRACVRASVLLLLRCAVFLATRHVTTTRISTHAHTPATAPAHQRGGMAGRPTEL